jgi:hypothetical protein
MLVVVDTAERASYHWEELEEVDNPLPVLSRGRQYILNEHHRDEIHDLQCAADGGYHALFA